MVDLGRDGGEPTDAAWERTVPLSPAVVAPPRDANDSTVFGKANRIRR
ncbi:hypothetical protein [Streptomyces naphthomycinicus]|nr:hypothetical protein [Streptomyces sp. TML10]